MAIKPVLRTKYSAVKMISGTISRPREAVGSISGAPPTIAKKRRADTHIASAGAAALNTRRWSLKLRRASCTEMTTLSTATARVPAAGPNSGAAANVKLSEIEKLAGAFGSRIVAMPLSAHSAARISHGMPMGALKTSRAEIPMTIAPAATVALR